MPPKVFDKICAVCGDKSSGFHFDAMTCESCKSFFRRNALKYQKMRCFLGGHCKVDLYNRTFCKRCRLKKCLDCGMKIEFILSEEQKQMRKIITEENRRRKINNKDMSSTDNTLDIIYSESSNSESNSSSDSLIKGFDSSLKFDANLQIESLVSNQKAFESDFILSDFSISILRPITDYSKIFNEMEGNHLTELLNAIQFMSNPLATVSHPINEFWDAIRVLHNKMDIDIRKLIKMSKSLTGFRSISENDQIILLKFASIEIVLIRMILYFDFQFEYWNIITNDFNSNQIKLEILKGRPRHCYENQKQFLNNFGSEWDSDPIIIDLLTVIMLFNPLRPKLDNKSFIKLQQQIYMHLLQRYLLIKYQSESESKSKFTKLMNSLIDLYILNEKIRLNILELCELEVIPLVKEICDRDVFLSKDVLVP